MAGRDRAIAEGGRRRDRALQQAVDRPALDQLRGRCGLASRHPGDPGLPRGDVPERAASPVLDAARRRTVEGRRAPEAVRRDRRRARRTHTTGRLRGPGRRVRPAREGQSSHDRRRSDDREPAGVVRRERAVRAFRFQARCQRAAVGLRRATGDGRARAQPRAPERVADAALRHRPFGAGDRFAARAT